MNKDFAIDVAKVVITAVAVSVTLTIVSATLFGRR